MSRWHGLAASRPKTGPSAAGLDHCATGRDAITVARVDHREREVKFDVPVDWQLPEPAALVPRDGSSEHLTFELDATYFDTAGGDLMRSGVTLRRRSGGEDEGWHLKVPAGDARTEIHAPLGGQDLPAELHQATAGLRRGADVATVALLHTRREVTRVLAADGTPRLEFAVDDVTATVTGRSTTVRQWREVEIELLEGTEKHLQKASDWLVAHGATPSQSRSKLARALAADTGPARDRRTLGGVLGRYLDEQFLALVAGDVALRRAAGGPLDADLVHRTRVATRRYRSALKVFAPAFEPGRAASLEAELGWLAGVLGDVRDLHVLGEHLTEQLAALPADLVRGPVADRIRTCLAEEESAAAQTLAAALGSERYFALLAEVTDWRFDLPVRGSRKAGTALKYLRQAERTVRKRWASVPDGPGRDTALHRVRKAAKRARYAAEVAEPAIGKPARRAMKDLHRTQRVLGARQDQVVAAAFLLRVASSAADHGEDTFTYGVLYERNATER